MIIDSRQVENGATLEADICIIGSGPAGISLAAEFLGTAIDVCILESGGEQPDAETQLLAGGLSTGHRYFSLMSTRLRMFGGTSGHWTGWCRPLDRIDFEARPWIPYSGWPLEFDELTEFYDRAQTVCDLGPYGYKLSDWLPAGNDHLLKESAGLDAKVIQFSPPTRFGPKYKRQIEESTNVIACLHANVTQINASPTGTEVESVSVATLTGRNFHVKAKTVVLAAGGLESPRLLLMSDSIQKEGLGNGKDVVGRYFMNHTFLPVGFVVGSHLAEGDSSFVQFQGVHQQSGGPARVQAYLAVSPEVQARERIANVSFNLVPTDLSTLIYGSDDNATWFEKLGLTIRNFDEVFLGAANRAYARFNPDKLQPVYSILSITEQTPNPASRVTLVSERDALGQRLLNLEWRLSDIDFFSWKRSHVIIGAELARAGSGRIVSDVMERDAWPDGYIGDWHHMGTTRMSDSDREGVVDRNCRVHGISNLYIAGSSVFPTSGYANPTLTIVALSLRLADHLKRERNG
ncbi:MAG: GMC family oxidoreductase [Gammaproteobacteria bacterium]|nr:GMC family oxidoreductase [Gammaproteobacteria bacterium]